MVRVVKKALVRKAEIVAAARQLFQEKGYENAAIQDVMAQLGIAKGTIYHYFQSKEALFEAVIEAIVSEEIERLDLLLQGFNGDALGKIRRLVQAGQAATYTQGALLDRLHQPANQGVHTRIVAVSVARQAPLFEALIRQGIAEGLFKTEHPLECAEFILAAVQFLTDPGIYPWTKEELTRRGQALPNLIEAQLQAPSGSFQFLSPSK